MRMREVVIELVSGGPKIALLVKKDVETVTVRYFRPESPKAVEWVKFAPSGETVTDATGTFPLWRPVTH